jgi:hypothetical protein
MNISTCWSMVKLRCFWRLFASLSTWLACQRRAQRPRLTTPLLPPRPSSRNNGISPEGASLDGPLATLTNSSGLSSGTLPWRHVGGWSLVDERPGGGEMRMGLVPGSEGILSASPSPSLHSAARRQPLSPLPRPVRYDIRRPPRSKRNTLGPGSASALAASLALLGGLPYLNSVGPGGVARSAGRPVVPEPRRRRASHCEQVLF